MKLNIQNLGPIESAQIDLSKDLIVISGQNNTGKTYLGYFVYYFLSNEPMVPIHSIPMISFFLMTYNNLLNAIVFIQYYNRINFTQLYKGLYAPRLLS